ncbi:hypothetical protein [Acinetobacter sp. NCu2D-2]|uniref:hypothetical protein n=1 Tax=Acinetobacter sp. NCu2D-2 TaxID=1608473 RepID=UPI0012FF3CC0|nr:hypothetical protein [Acinetobacter sp. NCu2D-2]
MTEDDLEKEEQPRYFSKIDQMYQHFNEQFEQNDFSAALTHILTESEQGSFNTALAACIQQEAFIRTSKVIDSHKLKYGLAYFAHIAQDYRSVFEINVIITYIALRIDQKTSTSTHKERIHYHCYLLLKRITRAEFREKKKMLLNYLVGYWTVLKPIWF